MIYWFSQVWRLDLKCKINREKIETLDPCCSSLDFKWWQMWIVSFVLKLWARNGSDLSWLIHNQLVREDHDIIAWYRNLSEFEGAWWKVLTRWGWCCSFLRGVYWPLTTGVSPEQERSERLETPGTSCHHTPENTVMGIMSHCNKDTIFIWLTDLV